eukprot:6177568-Pleurochrysis_carterae.AAC.1
MTMVLVARGGARPSMILRLRALPLSQRTVAASAVARQTGVGCETGICCLITKQASHGSRPGALIHRDKRSRTPSGSRCRHTFHGSGKCACTAINLGMHNLNLTHVTVAASVGRAPAEA